MQNDALGFDTKSEFIKLRDRVASLEKNVAGLHAWSVDVNREIADLKKMIQAVLDRLPPVESKA